MRTLPRSRGRQLVPLKSISLNPDFESRVLTALIVAKKGKAAGPDGDRQSYFRLPRNCLHQLVVCLPRSARD